MKHKLKFKNKLRVPLEDLIYEPYDAKEMKKRKREDRTLPCKNLQKKVSNYRQIAHLVPGFRLIDLESMTSES